jgi:hypothetical protein
MPRLADPRRIHTEKLRSTQLQKLRAYLETEELQPSYEHVLCAASIQQYCDDAETAANDGSIASKTGRRR